MPDPRKIFVVYGHDTELKHKVELVLQRLGLDPIFLDQEAGGSESVIERIERNSDVAYAIILVSPDDIGRSMKETPADMKYRARQNVVLEFGYFIAKLQRRQVLVLLRGKEDLEFPSDIAGIMYVECDERGNWKEELRAELEKAGFKFRQTKLSDISLSELNVPPANGLYPKAIIHRNGPAAVVKEPKETNSAVQYSEADIKALLSGWWDALDKFKRHDALKFADIDAEAGVPIGSAVKYIEQIVVSKGLVVLDQRGENIIKFKPGPRNFTRV